MWLHWETRLLGPGEGMNRVLQVGSYPSGGGGPPKAHSVKPAATQLLEQTQVGRGFVRGDLCLGAIEKSLKSILGGGDMA